MEGLSAILSFFFFLSSISCGERTTLHPPPSPIHLKKNLEGLKVIESKKNRISSLPFERERENALLANLLSDKFALIMPCD